MFIGWYSDTWQEDRLQQWVRRGLEEGVSGEGQPGEGDDDDDDHDNNNNITKTQQQGVWVSTAFPYQQLPESTRPFSLSIPVTTTTTTTTATKKDNDDNNNNE